MLFALLAIGQGVWATEHTVTYRITETHNGNAYTFTFVKSGTDFNNNTGNKKADVSDITSTTGFNVQLDNGLTLDLSMDQGRIVTESSGGYTGLVLNYLSDHNARIVVSRCPQHPYAHAA